MFADLVRGWGRIPNDSFIPARTSSEGRQKLHQLAFQWAHSTPSSLCEILPTTVWRISYEGSVTYSSFMPPPLGHQQNIIQSAVKPNWTKFLKEMLCSFLCMWTQHGGFNLLSFPGTHCWHCIIKLSTMLPHYNDFERVWYVNLNIHSCVGFIKMLVQASRVVLVVKW